MGWRDRDWARTDEREHEQMYRSGQAARRSSSGRTSAALLLAVGISAAIYVAGHFPRAHPIAPVLAFHLPNLGNSPGHQNPARSVGHMATTSATFGSTFTVSGTTPERKNGPVRVEGSWNGAPRQTLGTSTAVGGAYSVSFPIRDHGTLNVTVKYPGGEAVGTVLVP
jgi:hypothetical protein